MQEKKWKVRLSPETYISIKYIRNYVYLLLQGKNIVVETTFKRNFLYAKKKFHMPRNNFSVDFYTQHFNGEISTVFVLLYSTEIHM